MDEGSDTRFGVVRRRDDRKFPGRGSPAPGGRDGGKQRRRIG
jgi:hypothetical protein